MPRMQIMINRSLLVLKINELNVQNYVIVKGLFNNHPIMDHVSFTLFNTYGNISNDSNTTK